MLIESTASRFSEWCEKRNWVSQEDRDVFRYGIEIILSNAINIIMFYLLALLFSSLVEGTVFLLLFISIRQFTGGYHARSYLGCFVAFLAVSAAVFLLLRFTPAIWIPPLIILLTGLGLLPVILFAPVPNPEKRFTNVELAQARVVSVIAACLVSAVIVTLAWINTWITLAYPAALSLLTIGVSIMIPIVTAKGGEHCEEER